MPAYIMFGKYSADSIKKISAERTVEATDLIGSLGGTFKAGYALLGKTDVILIADFPGTKEAMKASVELNKMLGISFTTSAALSVEEFDELFAGG